MDAEGHLELRDLGDDPLEAARTEERVLLVLERLAERVVLRGADQRAELGEQDGVLARRVRPVHAAEGPERRREPGAALGGLHGRRRRQLPDRIGDAPPRLVLLAEDGHEVDTLVRPLEAREDEVLLELLVVVLHEAPDDVGGGGEDLERQRLLALDAPGDLLVDEEHATEDAVLAHQVLDRRHLLGSLLPGSLRGGRRRRARGEDRAGADRARENEEHPAIVALTAHARLRSSTCIDVR